MKVLMVSGLHLWSMGAHKGASSFFQTIQGYTSHGHHVDLIIGNRCSGLEDPNVRVLRLDVPLLRKLSRIPKIGFFFNAVWWLVFQLTAIACGLSLSLRSRPDVTYGYEILGVPAASTLGKLLHCPSVSRFQGTIMWSRMRMRFWKLRFWDHFLALKWPTDLTIMANDGTEGDRVLQTLGVDRQRVQFWMNGVDQSFLEPMPETIINELREELKLDANCQVLLTLSRLAAWKRVDRIIRAMPAILKHNQNVHLVIVGDGDARTSYEAMAEHLQVEYAITFAGAVPHAETRYYLELADIFVSLYDLSNMGNPLLEAMMAGKCIVTLNNGATGSVIRNNVNGVLMETDELGHLPETILQLLGDEATRTRLGCQARAYAAEHFWDWNARMDEEICQIRTLLPGSDGQAKHRHWQTDANR